MQATDTDGHGRMRHCMRQCIGGDEMVGQRLMRHSMGQGGMMRPFAMRIIFALMDRDGDGTISLEEFQAAHERIFKAMDADKDGTVSMDEMQDFIHGDREAGLPRRPGREIRTTGFGPDRSFTAARLTCR